MSATRLLSFSLARIILSLTLIFLPAQALAEQKTAEIILCPEKIEPGKETLLDEYSFARAYDKGYCGYIVNKELAEQWYVKAAEHGHILAQHHLGERYFTGAEGEPDYPKAKQWYLAAADQGYGLSQLRLAFLYAEAHFKGLTPDYAEAEKWFLKAAEQNAGDARFRLGNFYHNYKTPPDFKKALLWLTRAAEGGHRVAMFDLGRMLRKGEGIDKDPVKALHWIQKSAELDLLSAQMTLSEMYAAGDGVEKNPLQSLIWTLKVAGKPTAPPFWLNRAADIFFEGWETIPKDYKKAQEYYARAAAKGDSHAETRLGRIYLNGLGVPKDKARAKEYLEKAAASGDNEAISLLKEVH